MKEAVSRGENGLFCFDKGKGRSIPSAPVRTGLRPDTDSELTWRTVPRLPTRLTPRVHSVAWLAIPPFHIKCHIK